MARFLRQLLLFCFLIGAGFVVSAAVAAGPGVRDAKPRGRPPVITATIPTTTTTSTTTTTTTPTTTSTTTTPSPITLSDTFEYYNVGSWSSEWGNISILQGRLRLSSKTPTDASQTFSALVLSKLFWSDLSFAYDTTPVNALRAAPNTWETSWSFFRYSDLAHYYYLILKPNGWELGKKHGGTLDGNAPQIFLATGSSPTFPRGRTYRVLIEAALGHIVVFVDGNKLLDYTDANPLTQGRVGLYEEDCTVDFDNVQVSGALS